ncbi:hypothetical protein DPMN_041968 [Dreissena polymorpha]|uniref:Uncharacterized protein n=1 Tax=Dreissena polymorpha TaxID=45954 RepID=A0A9D4D094_DREPO|nr:hypothetical protein DPMN_041968 [Dreissena polymorpha]
MAQDPSPYQTARMLAAYGTRPITLPDCADAGCIWHKTHHLTRLRGCWLHMAQDPSPYQTARMLAAYGTRVTPYQTARMLAAYGTRPITLPDCADAGCIWHKIHHLTRLRGCWLHMAQDPSPYQTAWMLAAYGTRPITLPDCADAGCIWHKSNTLPDCADAGCIWHKTHHLTRLRGCWLHMAQDPSPYQTARMLAAYGTRVTPYQTARMLAAYGTRPITLPDCADAGCIWHKTHHLTRLRGCWLHMAQDPSPYQTARMLAAYGTRPITLPDCADAGCIWHKTHHLTKLRG